MKFEFTSHFDNEVGYLSYTLMNVAKRIETLPLPPLTAQRITAFRPPEQQQLILEVERDKRIRTPLAKLIEEFDIHKGALVREFFSRLDEPIPATIHVHVSRYGYGGSHHPADEQCPLPKFRGMPAITIRDPVIDSHLTLAQLMTHETLELILHSKTKLVQHSQKEALIDKLCSCDQLKAVYGKYTSQAMYLGQLPPDWETIVKWKSGLEPTWT